MVSGHPEHLVPMIAQAVEEIASIAELLGTRALGEVAADDDEVGLELIDLPFDRLDQPLVMGAEMEVGEVNDAGHGMQTRGCRAGSRVVIASAAKQSSGAKLDCRVACGSSQ